MVPPRPRQHLRPPLSRRARHPTTTATLPNSALGSARPFVRWINLRDVRRQDQASVWRARAGMTDCQEFDPIGWRLPRVALRRLRPQERSSLTSTVALRSIRCSRGSVSRGHGQGSGWATSSALTVPGKTERKPGIDRREKLHLSNVYAPNACKALASFTLSSIAQPAVSARNLRCKRCFKEKNRLTPMG